MRETMSNDLKYMQFSVWERKGGEREERFSQLPHHRGSCWWLFSGVDFSHEFDTSFCVPYTLGTSIRLPNVSLKPFSPGLRWCDGDMHTENFLQRISFYWLHLNISSSWLEGYITNSQPLESPWKSGIGGLALYRGTWKYLQSSFCSKPFETLSKHLT